MLQSTRGYNMLQSARGYSMLDTICYKAHVDTICYKAHVDAICYKAHVDIICWVQYVTKHTWIQCVTKRTWIQYVTKRTWICYKAHVDTICYTSSTETVRAKNLCITSGTSRRRRVLTWLNDPTVLVTGKLIALAGYRCWLFFITADSPFTCSLYCILRVLAVVRWWNIVETVGYHGNVVDSHKYSEENNLFERYIKWFSK